MSYGRDHTPWHTLTVAAIPLGDDEHDYDLTFDHPQECAEIDHCWAESDAREWFDMYDELHATGTYRVRTWYSGPDYEGDYDGGIEVAS